MNYNAFVVAVVEDADLLKFQIIVFNNNLSLFEW